MIFIPQANPKANYLAHKVQIQVIIKKVLESGSYVLGNEVRGFEKYFSYFSGVKYTVGVNSGTDALQLALRACGIGNSDAVVTVSHTAVATVAAIELAGAVPLLADIEPFTFTISPGSFEAIIKEYKRKFRIKAIIPVHLYGQPADLEKISKIASKNKIIIIEDCAQSCGARLAGVKVGSWGQAAAFSFYPTKNLGALGDAGAVITNDSRIAERVFLLRQYGWRKRLISEIGGTNSRLDEFQAAILKLKIKYLEQENSRRRQIASLYNYLLLGLPVITPKVREQAEHVFHQYVICTPLRDKLKDHLKKIGVLTATHYSIPIHLQPAYKDRLRIVAGGLPNTKKACKEILSLPMYPELKDKEVRFVCQSIAKFFKGKVNYK